MDESILALKRSLEEKTPTLLLGAGFSYGGVNANGEKLPLGSKLVNDLYQHMFIDNPPCKDILEEDEEGAETYKERGDLKGLCGLLRDEGRIDERNQYLTSVFSGATIDDANKIFNITNYRWNKIFTLNIDCLLEYIFEKKSVPFKVWNYDHDDRRNNNSDTLSQTNIIFYLYIPQLLSKGLRAFFIRHISILFSDILQKDTWFSLRAYLGFFRCAFFAS